jgi:hypothetical protein
MQGRGENTGDHNTLSSKGRQAGIKTPGVLAGFAAERVEEMADGRLRRRVECGQVVKRQAPAQSIPAGAQEHGLTKSRHAPFGSLPACGLVGQCAAYKPSRARAVRGC